MKQLLFIIMSILIVPNEITLNYFWFTNCAPCIESMKYFDEIDIDKIDGLEINLINPMDGKRAIDLFFRKTKIDLDANIIIDSNNTLKEKYKVNTFPTLALEKNGEIIFEGSSKLLNRNNLINLIETGGLDITELKNRIYKFKLEPTKHKVSPENYFIQDDYESTIGYKKHYYGTFFDSFISDELFIIRNFQDDYQYDLEFTSDKEFFNDNRNLAKYTIMNMFNINEKDSVVQIKRNFYTRIKNKKQLQYESSDTLGVVPTFNSRDYLDYIDDQNGIFLEILSEDTTSIENLPFFMTYEENLEIFNQLFELERTETIQDTIKVYWRD